MNWNFFFTTEWKVCLDRKSNSRTLICKSLLLSYLGQSSWVQFPVLASISLSCKKGISLQFFRFLYLIISSTVHWSVIEVLISTVKVQQNSSQSVLGKINASVKLWMNRGCNGKLFHWIYVIIKFSNLCTDCQQSKGEICSTENFTIMICFKTTLTIGSQIMGDSFSHSSRAVINLHKPMILLVFIFK